MTNPLSVARVVGQLRSRSAGTLGNPAYRRLMASTLVAHAVRFVDMTVLSWLVVQLSADPLPVALLSFCRFLPYLAAGPLLGFVADRFPRLRLVRLAQAGLAVLAVALAVLLGTGGLRLGHAYAYSACCGMLLVLDSTGRIRTRATGAPRKADVIAALGEVV